MLWMWTRLLRAIKTIEQTRNHGFIDRVTFVSYSQLNRIGQPRNDDLDYGVLKGVSQRCSVGCWVGGLRDAG